jgi:hypothetical protein
MCHALIIHIYRSSRIKIHRINPRKPRCRTEDITQSPTLNAHFLLLLKCILDMWFVSPITTELTEMLAPKLYEREQLHLIWTFSFTNRRYYSITHPQCIFSLVAKNVS